MPPAAAALDQTGVEHLLIVGHSQAEVATCSATWLDHVASDVESEREETSSYDRILSNISKAHHQLQEAKDHFTMQIAFLFQDETLRQKVIAGTVHAHLLFYVAESGTFLTYDMAADEFTPIAE